MITQHTQLENDLAFKDARVLYAASQTNHLAAVLHEENEKFWSMPTDRLLAVLNADVPATLKMFTANTALGQAVNASLDAETGPPSDNRVAPLRTASSKLPDAGAPYESVCAPTPIVVAPSVCTLPNDPVVACAP